MCVSGICFGALDTSEVDVQPFRGLVCCWADAYDMKAARGTVVEGRATTVRSWIEHARNVHKILAFGARAYGSPLNRLGLTGAEFGQVSSVKPQLGKELQVVEYVIIRWRDPGTEEGQFVKCLMQRHISIDAVASRGQELQTTIGASREFVEKVTRCRRWP